jgi:tetratricopeptide (TPR) repeat protein
MRALERSPEDDDIIEGLITTNLVKGDYGRADSLIRSHDFALRHRRYGLRDKYRFMRYGMAAEAFHGGDYAGALRQLELALFPPSSLGADDFQFETAPRLHYYIGAALEKLGKSDKALEAFEKSSVGWQHLTGGRDSWNSENFYMLLSLEKLGRQNEAERLLDSMKNFALGQLEDRHRDHRAQAHYLLALVEKKEGDYPEAERLLQTTVRLEPDMLGPRFELRRDVIDPLPGQAAGGANQ